MIDLKKLKFFLVKAKKQTYASNGKKTTPQRKGFKEFEFRKGDWYYKDSYSGFFMAPGQEVVYFKNEPVWSMSYNGGMLSDYMKKKFAKKTFSFLKECLLNVNENNPFRGPKKFQKETWKYLNSFTGDIKNFKGTEKIFFNQNLVFKQNYIGGLIIHAQR